MWKETTKHERNLKIFREEFEGFLPERILDFHVHVFNEGVTAPDKPVSAGGNPIAKYDLNDLSRDLLEVYPGRESMAVCFGFPEPSYDEHRNNDYLAGACDNRRFFAFRLFNPNVDTAADIESDLGSGRFLGLKPYPDYVGKADVHSVEIRDMLPDPVMEIVNRRSSIIMLHIPRKDRLADPLNQRQIRQLAQSYPRAKIILAHIGRAYFLKNIVGNLESLIDLDNVHYDLAMVNHWEVMEYLFRTVPAERILYGTDIPIGLAPGKSVEINDQYTYVTPVPWHLSISDDHGKLVFTSFLYEELRANKRAVSRLSLSSSFLRAIFYENGMRLLASAKRKMEGEI
ncbi:MAG: amidohydrolase family protein [Candidatus Hydrogenedentes bacterium]|nr:amidohydrolase family protein [Candidatus Hydrogenedentota bacterium]